MLKRIILFLSVFSLFMACKNPNDSVKPNEVDTSFLDKVNAKHKDLVTVISTPTTIVGKDLPYKEGNITWYFDGVFVKGRTLELKPYQMGKYEVSYELWTLVMDWALNNGYTFMFQGATQEVKAQIIWTIVLFLQLKKISGNL